MDKVINTEGLSYPKFNVKYKLHCGGDVFEKEITLCAKSVDSVKEYVYIEETESARGVGCSCKIDFTKIEEI